MPNQYPIFEFIENFKSSYKALDVRAALIKSENRWCIMELQLGVRVAPPEIVTLQHDKHPTSRKIDSPNFVILQFCLPFKAFYSCVEQFKKGELVLEELKVELDSPRDLAQLSGNLQSGLRGDNEASSDWPVLRSNMTLAGSNPYFGELYNDVSILRNVEIAGYDNVESAIKNLVRTGYSSSSIGLSIDLDIPACIDSVEAIKNQDDNVVLQVVITSHISVIDLICNIYKYKSSLDKQRIGRIELRKGDIADDLQQWHGDYVIQEGIEDHENLFFDLISGKIGRLHYWDVGLNQLFRREIRNPLYTALTHFCSIKQITDLITQPNKYESGKLKKDKLYEVSIQWLLACSGFRTIWLHQYEKLEPEKNLHGSVDSLAYHESHNLLLFVNCTLKAPEQKEIDSYRRVRRFFRDHVFNNTTVKLYSAVFADVTGEGQRKRPESQDDVRIFYREEAEQLLKLIEAGFESRLVDVLLNPFFYQL